MGSTDASAKTIAAHQVQSKNTKHYSHDDAAHWRKVRFG